MDPVSGPDSKGKPEEVQRVTPLSTDGLRLPRPSAARGNIDLSLMTAEELFVFTAGELRRFASKHGPLALNSKAYMELLD